MRVTINDLKTVSVIAIEGSVLQENVAIFQSRLNNLIENERAKIVVNMGKTQYISSMCLATIVDAKERAGKINGDLRIASPNSIVRNLLEITNLEKRIQIYDSVEEAVGSFEGK
jgi:anti-anti-sigma factor